MYIYEKVIKKIMTVSLITTTRRIKQMNQKDYENLSNHEDNNQKQGKESGIGLFFFKDDDQE